MELGAFLGNLLMFLNKLLTLRMTIQRILPIIYWVSMLSIGPWLFATSMQTGDRVWWLLFCVVSQFLFAFAAMAEIRNSPYLTKEQKSRWNGWLVCSPLFFGFFYLKHFRK
jgi:hypothetical protein